MLKNVKKLLVVLIVFVLMVSMVTATVYAVSTPKTEQKDTGTVQIESKEKAAKIKITWNANGGKIGSKKTISTTVTKGSKLKKLATTPKRSGYTFQGWFTQKSGGKKISKNTVPKKTLSYFAQWKKKASTGSDTNKTRVLTAEEKKLVGRYSSGTYSSGYWTYNSHNTEKWTKTGSYGVGHEFKSDGTYRYFLFGSGFSVGDGYYFDTGKWHISPKGTLHITNRMRDTYDIYTNYKGRQKMLDSSYKYVFTEKYGKNGIELTYSKSISSDFYEKR